MDIRNLIYSLGIPIVLIYSGAIAAPVISEQLVLEISRDLTCGPNKAHVEVYGGDPIDMFDAKRVIVKFIAYTGEESKLTFLTGSFGIHCPKHPLNFQGYFVFQTACPAKDFPRDAAPPCDDKNYFGVVSNAEVLIVPHWQNGKLASQLFNGTPKVRTLLSPVPMMFNATLPPQSNTALKRDAEKRGAP